MSYGVAAARYADVTAQTASPQKLLTMLYDRLITDLSVAEAAMRTQDHESTGRRLLHAQDILLELWGSLDTEIWPAGEQLRSLYLWMVNELVVCRLPPQPDRLATCRQLLEPLRDAWKQALELQATAGRTATTVDGAA